MFRFIPALFFETFLQDDEDLQLTVTPMRGDPALYASMGAAPTCATPDEEEGEAGGEEESGSGGDGGATVCSGW